VIRLTEAFGKLKEGDTITKEEISGVIQEPAGGSRWRTVVSAWRRKLYRESNILLVAVPTVGYEVAPPMRRVDHGCSKWKHSMRAMAKSADVLARTDRARLTAEAARASDHVVMVTGAMTALAATEAKRLRYPDTATRKIAGK
jgi:hypothetical protein